MGVNFLFDVDVLMLGYQPEFNVEELCAKLGTSFDENGIVLYPDEKSLPFDLKRYRGVFNNEFSATIKKVFHFNQCDLVTEYCKNDSFVFLLGTVSSKHPGYWVIDKHVFGIERDVLINSDIGLSLSFFAVGFERRTSVMKKISSLLAPEEEAIIIGGNHPNAIPLVDYEALLNNFPTTIQLEHYGEALIESYIANYLTTKRDYGALYEKSRDRQRQKKKEVSLTSKQFDEIRLEGFEQAYKELKDLLEVADKVPEDIWQEKIIHILPVVFPQYISIKSKVKIEDVLNKTYRELDFLLIDARGNIDVLEIKKAFPKNNLLMQSLYRDNHIPARELSGGVAQIEKYIHYLLNWGPKGEKILTDRYKDALPHGLSLRLLNPRGLLLIGHCEFNEKEGRDFDLICRQYSHIADIITYDDLLMRLDRMIKAITKCGV